MQKTYALGDPHGNYKGMMQCLEAVNFDYDKDRLIILGDICDGYPETKQCIDEALKIKDCIMILGNHDEWTLSWMNTGIKQHWHVSQGGDNTIASYGSVDDVPDSHRKFLRTAYLYWEQERMLFVHGGVQLGKPMNDQNKDHLLWDRDLICYAYKESKRDPLWKVNGYDWIYVGHTATWLINKSNDPIIAGNMINLDTGAGSVGPMTIMDIHTQEYWQSDSGKELYGSWQGR